MSAPFLGRPQLYWCGECNVPLLEKVCSCKAAPFEVPISPPGEVRPAFDADRARIVSAAQECVGPVRLPSILLLNKLGGMDRMDEVIVNGEIVGVFRYDIEGSCFEFNPRTNFYKWVSSPKRVFVPADVVRFLERGDLLAPGVSSCDPGISPGDWVFVCSDRPVACGIALMDSAAMSARGRGVAVKIKDFSNSYSEKIGKDSPMESAVAANSVSLAEKESEAISRMKAFAGTHKKPVVVSFSGGKDSLAVLLIAQRSGLDFSAVFADTGIEFPETISFVEKVGKTFNIIRESAGDSFFEGLPFFGPPARDFRWCCKSCKLGPLARLILKNFPDGCVAFGGERRFESESRMRRGFEGSNPWVSNQVSFYPLYNWNSLSVWLYLFWRKAEYNPLYKLGYERIGCFPCPASSLADLALLRESHPALYGRFVSFVRNYASGNGFPKEFVDFGLWRWKRLNPAMESFVKARGIAVGQPKVPEGKLSFRMVSGVSPCKSGGFSIECAFSRPLSLELISNLCSVLGDVKFSPSLGVLVVSRSGMDATIHSTGTVRIRGPSPDSPPLVEFSGLLREVVFRAGECVGCGVCAAACPSRSISISGRKAVVSASCTRCGSCLGFCPVVKFR